MSLNDTDLPVAYLARYDKKGFRTSIWKIVALFNATVVLIFLTVLPTVIQESIMEAVASLFFNGAFVWIYAVFDFTGEIECYFYDSHIF